MSGVSIIIPVKNGEEFLERCLSSIFNQEGINFEVIVVNNESTDNSKDVAEKFDVKIVESKGKSAAAVRNDGAKCAEFDIIGFLDADCVVPEGWVFSAYKLLKQEAEYGCVGGGCFADPFGTWVQKAWALSEPAPSSVVKALPGASMFFHKKNFQQIGGFNTDLISAEDDEICARVIESGKKIYRDDSLWVIHLDYPKYLKEHFIKSIWHGSTQIAAHGFLGDKLVFLTWLWGLCILSSLLSLFIYTPLAIVLICISFVLPMIFALKRSGVRSIFSRSILYIPITYIICATVMAGRLLGMVKEVITMIKIN